MWEQDLSSSLKLFVLPKSINCISAQDNKEDYYNSDIGLDDVDLGGSWYNLTMMIGHAQETPLPLVSCSQLSLERVSILTGDRIVFSVVHTEPPEAILLPYHYNGQWPGATTSFTTPCSSNLVTSTSTTPLSTSGILCNGCQTGGPLVRIKWLKARVQPTSPPLGANKSENWIKDCGAVSSLKMSNLSDQS